MEDNSNKSRLFRPVSKDSKSTKRLKKLYTVVLVLMIILLLTINYINKHSAKQKDIYKLVGNNVAVSIPTKTALMLRECSIVPLVKYLEEGDYESAYGMCTSDFKARFSLEDFINLYSEVDVSSIDAKEIKAKGDYCYEATVVYLPKDKMYYSGELVKNTIECTYLLYPSEINSTEVRISPNGFLYSEKDKVFERDGIKLTLNTIDVYNDHTDLDCSIQNIDWNSKLDIHTISVGFGDSMKKEKLYKAILEKEESIDVSITFDDIDYFMPDNVQIEHVKDEKTLRTEIFYLKDGKNP